MFNVYWDRIDLSKIKTALFEDDEIEKYTVRNGDLLICEGGDVGRCAIWEHEEPTLYQNALHRVRFYRQISSKYFMYVFMCYKAMGITDENSKGVTIKHLVQKSLHSLYLPLPPLNEQHRIVQTYGRIIGILKDEN